MQPGKAGSGFRSSTQRRILNRSSASFAELLGRDPRGKRTEVLRGALHAADARGHGRARIRVVEDELDERRKTQPQALVVGLGKLAAQRLVEQERRFEVGAGRRPLHPAYPVTQAELAGLSFDCAEQSLQAAAQVRRLADVGLADPPSREARTPPRSPEQRQTARNRGQGRTRCGSQHGDDSSSGVQEIGDRV